LSMYRSPALTAVKSSRYLHLCTKSKINLFCGNLDGEEK
jgi:hypothetical protein